MTAPTYTVTKENDAFAVLRDGVFHAGYTGAVAAHREARRLNLIAKAEEMLALLVEHQELAMDWQRRRDALIAKITGETA